MNSHLVLQLQQHCISGSFTKPISITKLDYQSFQNILLDSLKLSKPEIVIENVSIRIQKNKSFFIVESEQLLRQMTLHNDDYEQGLKFIPKTLNALFNYQSKDRSKQFIGIRQDDEFCIGLVDQNQAWHLRKKGYTNNSLIPADFL